MNNRIKKLKTPAIKTRAEMEILVREIAGLKLNEKLLVDNMDAEIRDVRQSYEGQLNTVSQVLTAKIEAARVWADANPGEFGARKSIEFVHGTIGFRTGKPKLKFAPKWDADRALEALKAFPWGAAYVRVKQEINKEQILGDIAARKLSEGDLREVGALVVQEETFFADPKLTRVETREVAKAA